MNIYSDDHKSREKCLKAKPVPRDKISSLYVYMYFVIIVDKLDKYYLKQLIKFSIRFHKLV